MLWTLSRSRSERTDRSNPRVTGSPHRTVVIGAGIGGLACAYHLKRAGRAVTVLEAAARAGGVVGTIEADGFRFEMGPNTIQASSAEFRTLAGELGLTDRLVASDPNARRRYLWHAGQLRALPSPLTALTTRLLSLQGKWNIATELLRRWKPPAPGASEPTMRAFLSERLGDEATERLAGAFVRGVYAAELDELGARSAFPRMWQACVDHGGLIRGLRAAQRVPRPIFPGPQCEPGDLMSFQDGLQELVDALAKPLGTELRLATRVNRLTRAGVRWKIECESAQTLEADTVVLAVPAPVCVELLASADLGEDVRAPLARIGHARVVVAHLGLDARAAPPLPRGFGFLVPPDAPASESPQALGTIFASNLFPRRAPAGYVAVTSFYSADTFKGWPDASIAELASRDLALALRRASTYPIAVSRVMHWNDVIPRYAPGHDERIAGVIRQLAANAPGLHLSGSYVGGVAVERVLAQGRALARTISAGGRSA